MKRSPGLGKRQDDSLAPRPFSMFASSQRHTKSSSWYLDLPQFDENASSKKTSFMKLPSGRLKRNSSAEFSTTSSNTIDSTGEFEFFSPQNSNEDIRTGSLRAMPSVGPSASTWTTPKTIKKLNTPGYVFGVHIAKSGTCYVSVVTEKGEKMIQAYDRNGNLLKTFQPRTTKVGKQYDSYQIHETPQGNLAVASGTCVTVWSKEGKLMVEHGRNMFKFAKYLAVRSTGEIVVTDTDNNAVKIISSNGQHIYDLEGKFYCPVGVAIDSKDNIIISDWRDKLRIFDADNQLVTTFGVKGSSEGELDLPYGVSVDSQDNIVVADMWNHRLSVYSPEGTFLKHLAYEPGKSVRLPAHISVSTCSDDYWLAITDFGANSVKLFTY